MFSELKVRGAPTTTRARIFCRRCNLSMFACDIPCSTVTVIKPTTNDRNSRVKCQQGTYVTHTCLFYLLTWLLQGACRPVIPYDVPVSHTHATAPTQYQAGIGSVPDQFWIGTDPVPDRYRPGRPLIGHCLRRASFTAPPPSQCRAPWTTGYEATQPTCHFSVGLVVRPYIRAAG